MSGVNCSDVREVATMPGPVFQDFMSEDDKVNEAANVLQRAARMEAAIKKEGKSFSKKVKAELDARSKAALAAKP